jgi:hypothetical protein
VGRRIRVEGRRIRLDGSTLACSGAGRPAQTGGTRRWTRFRCVQPTFRPGVLVGPDAVFTVEVAGPRTLDIVRARFTGY